MAAAPHARSKSSQNGVHLTPDRTARENAPISSIKEVRRPTDQESPDSAIRVRMRSTKSNRASSLSQGVMELSSSTLRRVGESPNSMFGDC